MSYVEMSLIVTSLDPNFVCKNPARSFKGEVYNDSNRGALQ